MTAPQQTRNRRLTPRRVLLAAILLLTAAPIITYAALAVRFYTARPSPTHDGYAEHNARHAHRSDEERAWALYVNLGPRLSDLSRELRNAMRDASDPDGPPLPNPFDLRPADPAFAQAAAAIAASGLLDDARHAARRPVIATYFTDRYANDPPRAPEDFLPPSGVATQRKPLLDSLLLPAAATRDAAKLLVFDAHRAVAENEPQRAVENLRDTASIARQWTGEPGMIAGLLGFACAALAADAAVEIVESHPTAFDADQLRTLEETIHAAAAEAGVDFESELVLVEDFIQHLYAADGRMTPHGYDILRRSDASKSGGHSAALPVVAIFFMDHATQTESLREAVALARRIPDDPAAHVPAWVSRQESLRLGSDINLVGPLIEPALGKAALSQIQSRTQLRAAATRLALERFKLAEGRYPDALAELVPAYLPELPEDPFNPGHPIKYLLRDAEPVLYSVGANAVDDHATPAPPNTRPDDLKARFADPGGPAPDAAKGDWILYPKP